jgi:hypothetical protein
MKCPGLHCEGCGRGGGSLVLAVTAAALLIGSGAASAIVDALVMILIITGCTIGLAAVAGIAWLIYRARQDRPGRPIAARPVYQLAPETRPHLEAPGRPAIGPAREIHLHLHGLPPDQLAAIVTQRVAYLEEDDR